MQELEFIKQGSLNAKELDAFVSVLQLAGEKLKTYNSSERKQMPSTDKSVSSLESMGVRVYGLDEPILNSDNNEISWENIAGYHQQKRYASFNFFVMSYVLGKNYLVRSCTPKLFSTYVQKVKLTRVLKDSDNVQTLLENIKNEGNPFSI